MEDMTTLTESVAITETSLNNDDATATTEQTSAIPAVGSATSLINRWASLLIYRYPVCK